MQVPKINDVHARASDVADLELEVLKFLLGLCILLGHFLVFLLPLIACGLKSLDLAFVMASFDVGLS